MKFKEDKKQVTSWLTINAPNCDIPISSVYDHFNKTNANHSTEYNYHNDHNSRHETAEGTLNLCEFKAPQDASERLAMQASGSHKQVLHPCKHQNSTPLQASEHVGHPS